ncbi:endonuclease-reverse transcriptase [Plakobranchus ocellatus]|uniref:Endonuclease-reverse transcriptase n=1 Tax=Plakobranchus ocellatus TaxID=259542 RepID=A0AAV4A744_9GAST|nr:endonuclease-reverse transcriptase [Plakobranchus ocellatus]
MWFIWKIMKVSWTKRKTNADVMDMAGYKRSLLNIIRERQLDFYGHIIRAGGLEKLLWSPKMCGNKSKGRQHTTFTDNLNKFGTNKEGTNNELKRKTENREKVESHDC